MYFETCVERLSKLSQYMKFVRIFKGGCFIRLLDDNFHKSISYLLLLFPHRDHPRSLLLVINLNANFLGNYEFLLKIKFQDLSFVKDCLNPLRCLKCFEQVDALKIVSATYLLICF